MLKSLKDKKGYFDLEYLSEYERYNKAEDIMYKHKT